MKVFWEKPGYVIGLLISLGVGWSQGWIPSEHIPPLIAFWVVAVVVLESVSNWYSTEMARIEAERSFWEENLESLRAKRGDN